jgi:hypothetical protein
MVQIQIKTKGTKHKEENKGINDDESVHSS